MTGYRHYARPRLIYSLAGFHRCKRYAAFAEYISSKPHLAFDAVDDRVEIERKPSEAAAVRVVVTGTSGAGKTTLARRVAALLSVPHIELDAINWQPGWRALMQHDPEAFVHRVKEAIAAETWVVDGNYGLVRDIVWKRASHLIWLDYERPVIMARVIRRTLRRAMLRTELWNGNCERFRVLARSHPIRWAWDTWERRRCETAELLGREDFANLVVLRLRRPREVRRVLDLLARR